MTTTIPVTDITSENKCDFCSAKCCQYITQEIDTPRSIHAFDVLLWQLAHEGVHVFKDDNGWYLLSMARCRHLLPNNMCGIYETRPMICREHANDSCEMDVPIDEGCDLYFQKYEELDEYCRKRFKKWDQRFEDFAKEQEKEAKKAAKEAAKEEAKKQARAEKARTEKAKAKKAKEKKKAAKAEKTSKKGKEKAKKTKKAKE